jgi:rRNA maturation endonuclease Nob1
MDANNIQMRMQEMQQTDAFAEVFGKLVSGKSGYKPVIEKKKEVLMCKRCMTPLLIQEQKFCHECGMQIEHPKKS